MTNPNLTHLAFLLDRSGSMQSIASDTCGGFDAFIEEQRRQPGECRVTLAQFDDRYEEVFRDLPIDQVRPLRLHPRGSTALLDSIGRLLTDTAASIEQLPQDQRPGTVIVGIMTDGMENASHEWNHPGVKALIELRTKVDGWQFLYMGADQDAIEVGSSMGIAPERAVTYSRGKAGHAMRTMSAKVGSYRESKRMGADDALAAHFLDYSAADRRDLED